jgi:hypothetical protein
MKFEQNEVMVVNGRLTQVGKSFRVKLSGQKKRYAVFQCECGARKVMDHHSVKVASKSCGCLTMEALKAGKHNENREPLHGKSKDKVYHAWSNVVQRCTNPKNKHYANYGGRGITVCKKWQESFVAFLSDVGEPKTSQDTIDRIDNENGYEPGNVRWVSRKQNQRNRRNTVYVNYNGKKTPLVEACEKLNVCSDLVRSRLVWGWTFEEAVRVPKYGKRNI